MMEAVGLVDPALVEQAAGPARRHSARRPLRTGLIAACLCAALLGSAWAANQIGGFQSLKFFEDLLLPAELSDDGEALGEAHYDGYTLEGGIDFLALEDLPQEALDMAAEHPASTVGLDLTSWEEAEAYFGLELPENTYLQEQLQSGFRAALSLSLIHILLVLLTQANIGSFTMADSAVFPAVLTGISLLCVLLSLRGAETRDLM